MFCFPFLSKFWIETNLIFLYPLPWIFNVLIKMAYKNHVFGLICSIIITFACTFHTLDMTIMGQVKTLFWSNLRLYSNWWFLSLPPSLSPLFFFKLCPVSDTKELKIFVFWLDIFLFKHRFLVCELFHF